VLKRDPAVSVDLVVVVHEVDPETVNIKEVAQEAVHLVLLDGLDSVVEIEGKLTVP
jgi:hypothetical protein